MLRLSSAHRLFARSSVRTRFYSSDLDPSNKKDYSAYVSQWKTHFSSLDDSFELERGLNHIFAADWVPSVDVVEDALRAARRLNCFATSVRILEALENKIDNPKVFEEYRAALGPLVTELGIPSVKEFGKFETVRDVDRWWYDYSTNNLGINKGLVLLKIIPWNQSRHFRFMASNLPPSIFQFYVNSKRVSYFK